MKQKMNQKEISILGLFWDVLVVNFSDRYTNGKISQAGMVCTDSERAGKIVFLARSLPIGNLIIHNDNGLTFLGRCAHEHRMLNVLIGRPQRSRHLYAGDQVVLGLAIGS